MTNAPRAAIYELRAPRTLEIVERPLDLPLREGRVLAQTRYSVISPGTETAAWVGKPPLRPAAQYPRLVGYCNVAKVLDAAAGSDVGIGDYILTHQSHRSHFVVPRSEILLALRDADDVTLRRLATVYLYHLAYAALISARFQPGTRVAVIGLGALGFAASGLVQALGGRPIVFTGRRLATPESSLAGALVVAKDISGDALRALEPEWDGADIVINTSDSWEDYLLSLQTARRGATVLLLGFPGRGLPAPGFNPLDPQYLYDKQLCLRQTGQLLDDGSGSFDAQARLRQNLALLWDLVTQRALDPLPLVASCLPWRELAQAYDMLLDRQPGRYSALLDWSSP